jgi:hypothetical protein
MNQDIENGDATLSFAVSSRTDVILKRVWETLGDFGNEHRWTRTLVHCERDTPGVDVGTSRTCTLAKPLMGRTQVREELIEFSPGKALMYKLDGPAGPFRTAASRWTTCIDTDGKTVITVEGRFTPRSKIVGAVFWPIVKPHIARLTRRVLAELDLFLRAQQRIRN